MLVLSRKIGEEIIIGDSVRVRVLEVLGAKVRLGIEAPHEVSVHRAEVYRSIREFRESAEPVAEVGSGI